MQRCCGHLPDGSGAPVFTITPNAVSNTYTGCDHVASHRPDERDTVVVKFLDADAQTAWLTEEHDVSSST